MSQPDTAHPVSEIIAQRIEALFGQPITELEALADHAPDATLLAALTGGHSDLVLAERTIAFQLARLRELTAPDREIGRFAAGHILDCARRIAEAVATRDACAKNTGAVLAGLRRAPAPDPETCDATRTCRPGARPVPHPLICPAPLEEHHPWPPPFSPPSPRTTSPVSPRRWICSPLAGACGC
ncbi:hypothetical protein ACWD4G_38260 [Streptomyces sp. NPDC002643]